MSNTHSGQTRVQCRDCKWSTHRTYDTDLGYGTCTHCPSTKRLVPHPPAHSASRNAKIAADFERFNR